MTQLLEFASLPADTFAEGPPSGGNDGTGNPIAANGRTGPFDSQPVQGFSGVQFADENGVYWFLSDNGFGSKANSSDFLLRIHKLTPNFAGAENGDGTVAVEEFIGLADPNNLIPWDIVNEETSERLLTGSDLDVESIVVDNNENIWIGDEFGPYILKFDSAGILLETPIATPNIFELNNLNGQELLVIGHRGASGTRPEHTLEAYALAIEQGADFIEPDLVSTKDGVLIARHEPNITSTTDVAEKPEFADRFTTKVVDGVEEEGWFAEDFTLAEIKTLRAVQRLDFRDQSFNGQFEIPTLDEVIDLVQEVEAETGKQIGIYTETKHPTYFDELGLSLEEKLVQTLLDQEFTDPNRLFLQSFEVANLLDLEQNLLPETELENTPLVQLYDVFESQPYDIVANFEDPNFDPIAVYGTDLITAQTNYGDLIAAESLSGFINTYAEGIGPWKRTFVITEPLDQPVDGNGDGIAEITEQLTGEVLPVIEDAHKAGLQVHPYTFRDEERYMVLEEDGTPQTPEEEYAQYIRLGVDGYFTDFPATGNLVREQVVADEVRSPDNPAVEGGEAVANLQRSRGFEGTAYSPDGSTLYPMLEGAVVGDPEDSRRIYQFDVVAGAFQGLVGFYQVENPSNAIGDFTPINEREFLVIERDNNQGEEAQFKKIFKIDISEIDEAGFVAKEEIVDLLNIDDPNDLNGDGETQFTFPFQTIENVIVLDENRILVANDNNFPFSVGRGPDIDNNEIIVLELEEPLDLDPSLGENPVTPPENKVVFGTAEDDEFDAANPEDEFDGNQNTLFARAGNDLVNASQGQGGNRIFAGPDNDQVFAGNSDLIKGGAGADTLDASLGSGKNQLNGGGGADELIAGTNDTLNGGAGKDVIDASLGQGNNELYGDKKSDRFFLGSNDTLWGGSGDDEFYAFTNGDNEITGGSGADQFWIATAEYPESANIITDFELGVDVIGIAGLGIGFADLELTMAGDNTLIGVENQPLAILNGIESGNLTQDNFVIV
ncbi:MAG: esterase-like activity of phytase family protein [Gomphosphaeria aponina SAG 52.96 = DSM 107014]|uniref:Esterase-like activity of phytase family protein n=1 Tax=Gomphosphaeria aponina SAG 52.96 = DSM 107014 TaxID=1521640 RepID=A0A941JNU3_9CHRO|nr:esterase-like activity of phytase family protein [Gomphosphaeria aponina SAG 52.96 = DSM 107014]